MDLVTFMSGQLEMAVKMVIRVLQMVMLLVCILSLLDQLMNMADKQFMMKIVLQKWLLLLVLILVNIKLILPVLMTKW